MVCQNCHKRPATVHFTQVVNNKKTEVFICNKCANENENFNFNSPINLNSFFPGIMSFGVNGAYEDKGPEQVVCSKCGMTFDEFQNSGKLGCGNCLEVFEDSLKPLLKRLHGTLEHHGKMPGKVSKGIKVSNEIKKLKDLLRDAIRNEEYEKAAQIRDEIRSLEV